MQNKIVLDEIGSPGTYSGDLTLAPGGTDKVSLTVDVGDWILYPLIVVGLSALGGGFGVGLWQVSRRRQLLRARLDRIVRDYVSARSSWPKDDPQYLLDDELSDEAVTSLKTRIAATKEDADFDSLTAATLDLADDVSRWRQVDHGTRELLKLRHDLPGDAPDVTADTDSALDNTHLKPTDDVASAHLVGKLTRQARIAREFLRVEKLFANHRPAPDPALDPRRAYAAHRHAYLDDMHTEALLRELERLRHQLQQAPRTRYKTLLEAVAPARVEDELDLATVIEQTLPAQEQLPKIPKEDPARIERRVRMWDWILASVTAGLTILGFTFTIYSDHFGTWEDYGKALVAGFGGQLAGATIAWNAFPPLRSYTLRRPSGPA
jgi:hypothetical protein